MSTCVLVFLKKFTSGRLSLERWTVITSKLDWDIAFSCKREKQMNQVHKRLTTERVKVSLSLTGLLHKLLRLET
jgi:hypothetical protein